MMNTELSPRLLTLAEAARALSFSVVATRQLVHRGELVAIRLSPRGRIRITESEITRFIEAHVVHCEPIPRRVKA
jgi:excisionase family DNA binding protein